MQFLRDRFGSAAQVAVMRPGEWSAAYSVKTADADLVARFSVYDEDFEKDAYAARYSSTHGRAAGRARRTGATWNSIG